MHANAHLRAGLTGAMRIAHLVDSFHLRAEVHGGGILHTHLCMANPNTTYYESLIATNPVVREPAVDNHGLVHAPTAPGVGWETQWETPRWEADHADA